MNKPIIIIVIVLVLIFIALSAPRSIKTSNFTLGDVNGGNTLVLHNGYEIVLLGVSGSDKSQDYLKGFVGKDIRIIMDSSSPRLGKTKKGEKKRIYAYVKYGRKCLNSEILHNKLSDICVTPNLCDSLDSYLAYVGKDNEYVYPEPEPQPKPDNRRKEQDPIPEGRENKSIDPHKGTQKMGWSSECSDNCEMLSDVADFRNPITRNFAVKLASKSPGSYNFGQVCAIFDNLYNNWKYVNDPEGAEYVAKASESISQSSLSGDCDDFAICMASCIIAIGGEARVNTAWGPRGGHAFAEVCINGLSESEVKRTIAKMFPHYSISKIHTQTDDGNTWLNLDWQAAYPGGQYFQYTHNTTYVREYGEKWNCK